MTSEVQQRIANLVEKARSAQRIFDGYNQAQVDEVVTAVGWAIINEKNNHLLTEMAIKDTGIGKYDDKIQKNYRKTLGLLRDLKGAKSVGVIAEYPELGLIEIARPVGVVGAVVPSTNPVATPFNKTLNALKGRNAIIIAPSPKGQQVCAKLVELIHAELTRVGAPTDLVQHLELPVNKAETYELMKQVDLMVATGSGNNVRACYESGTPAVGVGAGNVPVIVDDSANLADAAAKIRASKTFDNATSCSSENSLVILDAVYDDMIKALQGENAVLLNAEQKQQLQNRLWENGHLHRDVIAQTASRIAEITGFEGMADASILMVEETGIGSEFPYSDEKLSPVLTIYRAKDFDDAFDIVNRILDFKGKGHSVGIHTSNDEHIMRIGLDMPTCRVIVNQAHCFATGGSFDNGLPFSLSMGCGSWGGNSIADNMNYKHYLNTTRIARTIPKNEPTSEDIFGDFWNKFSIDAQALSRTYNTMNTVKSIIDNHAISQPGSIFLISPEIDYELSFAELKQSALELEKRFTALGIGRGEKVAFLMSNGLWSAKLFLGAMYSGRVIVPLNAVCGNDQLAYVIDHCDAEVIFVEDQIRQKYKTVFANIDSSIRVISTCRNNGPEWPDATPAAAKEHETGSITPDDEALLIYTSGTTGRPKGVLLTHKAVVAGGNNTAVAHQLTSEDRALCVLQLYHINGEMVTVMGPLVSGGSVVMPNKFSANEFWSLIDRWQCSWFSVVPTIIAYLLEQAERLGEPDYKASDRARLRFGRCASAPLAPDMHRQFEQQFAVPIIETMGLSETAAQILSNPMPPGKSKYGSPGIAFGNEAMIIDKQGNKQAPMESGELMIRGDNVLKEYYKNPEVTAETLRPDGWLHTGDLAYEDEDGYFFITGRLKEIIIKGGENIAPREIDEALYQHAAVLEAAAFPIPDRNYGQEILACVALKPGASCSAEELRALCIEKLGKFKAPKSISFMGELPKGPSGKIQRLKLAEAALKVS